MKEKRVYRSCSDRYIAGICGGLAKYFDLDPLLVRLVFVILGFSGISIVFYFLAWVFIPNDPTCKSRSDVASEIRQKAQEFGDEFKKGFAGEWNGGNRRDTKAILGVIIILFGIVCLIQITFQINIWAIGWPIILIILGIILLRANGNRKQE
ncbi:MAG: PspC domain-containing protein [Patescibacteria group bacterium]|jgi:phage shock protein PspC (stress-responsive transcriptional regulator)